MSLSPITLPFDSFSFSPPCSGSEIQNHNDPGPEVSTTVVNDNSVEAEYILGYVKQLLTLSPMRSNPEINPRQEHPNRVQKVSLDTRIVWDVLYQWKGFINPIISLIERYRKKVEAFSRDTSYDSIHGVLVEILLKIHHNCLGIAMNIEHQKDVPFSRVWKHWDTAWSDMCVNFI